MPSLHPSLPTAAQPGPRRSLLAGGLRAARGACAALLLGLLAVPAARAQMGPMTFSVRVAPSEQREVARALEFTGSLQPWRQIDLSAKVEGHVTSVTLEPGMAVRAGQVLIELDREGVALEVRQLEADLRGAQAELKRLASGNREEDVEEARKRVAQAEAHEKSARDDWERQRPLVEQGVISRNEGTRVENTWRAALAELEAQRAASRRVETGFRQEEIATQRATVAAAQARLDDAKRRLREHSITAPLDAVVTERLCEPGEWVSPGDAVLRLMVLDPLKVVIDVPQIHIAKIAIGQPVQLRIDGQPGRNLTAEVAQIVPAAGSDTRNFPVWMRLPNPGNKLPSGLFARALLSVGDAVPTTLVPREAVQIRGETLVVLVAEKIPPPAATPAAATTDKKDAPPGPAAGGGEKDEAADGGGAMGGFGPTPAAPDAIVREVEVRAGNEYGPLVAVEVVQGEPIRPGQEVIVMGGTRMVNGMPVHILREAPAPAGAAPGSAPAPTPDAPAPPQGAAQ